MKNLFYVPLAVAVLLIAAGEAHAQNTEERSLHTIVIDRGGAEAQVRPGDQIVLRIWREPELSDTFTVAVDGSVVLPRLGQVQAADRSIAGLQDWLRVAYAEYLRNPSVEVTVLRRIAVQGEVSKPDLYMVDLTMTLRDVIAAAGGITQAGDANNIAIIRDGERIQFGKGEIVSFSTAGLRSGDQVVVGRRSWLALNSLAVTSTVTGLITVIAVVIPALRGQR